ncbi:hypothetical protein M513_12128 [Trichuris suis]|uniref:Uncharacterized protein n=1 Tax=Trichuris suis TaxID=68888 RepID=A0A085LPV2_9BILA|nr:hypothetical protein M513_12128 [Trichuris suis]
MRFDPTGRYGALSLSFHKLMFRRLAISRLPILIKPTAMQISYAILSALCKAHLTGIHCDAYIEFVLFNRRLVRLLGDRAFCCINLNDSILPAVGPSGS